MKHVVSVSGGKDSTATYLKALESGFEFRAVAADTGNEHPATYEAVNMLSVRTGGPVVEWVKADFTQRILKKRAFVERRWHGDLQQGVPGEWVWKEDAKAREEWRVRLRAWRLTDRSGPKPETINIPAPPPMPADLFDGRQQAVPVPNGMWIWKQGYAPLTEAEAAEVVEVALTWLVPTGNPYLDLCIWKGRFPSRRAQFCTEELKVTPINDNVTRPLLDAGHTVISWQGVRADESLERGLLPKLQQLNTDSIGKALPGRLFAYRPLLTWKIADVFALAERHGIPPNPLYAAGCSRVGCFPCINATKAELALVDRVFPEQIDRLAEWEARVSKCAKRGMTTFFNIINDPVMAQAWGWSERFGERLELSHETHGVRQMIAWAKTDRGGRQFNMFPEATTCMTKGFCE